MRVGLPAVLFALLLSGCAVLPSQDASAAREPTPVEEACIRTSYAVDPPVVRPGEGVVLMARFESCDDEAIWHHSYGCPGTPVLHRVEDEAADGSVDYDARWTLGYADLSGSSLPVCETAMPDPADLRAFAPGEVQKVEARWNATLRTPEGVMPAPPGLYKVTIGFATASVVAYVNVEAA